ncbi:NAD(P)/FAD-dependent oxidoreductase [Streptomyces sp. NBC_01264]|uniref:NAD(P)/FAD-dependent oxidoreductase n=1 Tax=Streptomyces sp. NBC_01264 TaxID=2903804 RepID=UPI0022539B7B|nr:FAD-dependent oxidoreductase [Streptomyces sp. NBC_01264]MCX4778282.1 FAD-dependent oxidoreductase [Streptomyces sp. NBC_01264]
MTSEQQRVVVIGGGLAGLRLAARLGGDVRVLGEEEHAPYNRVLLAEVLAGRYAPEVTALPAPGPALRRGVRAVRIDRAERVVHCDDGSVERYGTLVLATGSNPVLPPLRGLFEPEGRELPAGVHAFRTMDDCLALSAAVRPGVRAVVIGGGLLGVSAARALAERGAQVVLTQQGERLMERQLDAEASELLSIHLSGLGVEIHTECRVRGLSTAPLPGLRPGPRASNAGEAGIAQSTGSHVQADASRKPAPPAFEERGTPSGSRGRVRAEPGTPRRAAAPEAGPARVPGRHPGANPSQGPRRVTGVELADGYRLDADLVVLACGVRPRTGLAQAAGLDVRKGILVDDRLRTSDPRIHAIGDCAEHTGRVYGLAGPALEQAEALAGVLLGTGEGIPTGAASGYTGTHALTRLTLTGGGDRPLDLAAFGETTPLPGDDVVRLADATRRTYRKVVIRGDRLVGGVLFGELSSVGALARSWEDGAPLTDQHGPTDLHHLLTDDGGS